MVLLTGYFEHLGGGRGCLLAGAVTRCQAWICCCPWIIGHSSLDILAVLAVSINSMRAAASALDPGGLGTASKSAFWDGEGVAASRRLLAEKMASCPAPMPTIDSWLSSITAHQPASSTQTRNMTQQAAPIDIGELPLPQLQAVKQQMEEEIQHLTSSFSQLKHANSKFVDSIDCLNSLTPQTAGNEILVPLTSSLYLPGQLTDVEKVIVDLGTGYYVEKSIADAKTFYKTKIDYLRTNLEKLQDTISQRQNQYKALTDVMQYKIQLAAQEQAKERTKA
ncbi:Prefoldin [Polychytrium aggregatum]|uniref:Prefoldin n=1 Tax=Polychytrium aggregatum TaxID=110093 RepID=UPI0022FF014C|nr:Prefoldin [Polychytrium aggregatum]KAI9193590.1 Prefoldin [Polychytrium aggregatum]